MLNLSSVVSMGLDIPKLLGKIEMVLIKHQCIICSVCIIGGVHFVFNFFTV
jgi:hypothetical protein